MTDLDVSHQHDVFRDCLLAAVVEKLAPGVDSPRKRASRKRQSSTVTAMDAHQSATNPSAEDPAELVDFAQYLSESTFSHLPETFRCLSYQSVQSEPSLSNTYSLPLTMSTLNDLSACLPPSLADNLLSYALIAPPVTDVQTFMSPVFAGYITSVTERPPKWVDTKTSACEICERYYVPLTYHHLIPRQIHEKVLKRGWHEESQLDSVAWLCRACHSFVHKMASNEELARKWYTVDRICEREDVQKWAQWIRRMRWKKT